MNKICCEKCYYLTSKLDKEFPLSDYHTKWGCSFHNLHNGEVSGQVNKDVMIFYHKRLELEMKK
jgi:hypothetical protein